MIYENPIIFQKLVRSDSKEKNSITKNIIKSIICRKFNIFEEISCEKRNASIPLGFRFFSLKVMFFVL